ncbi:MAG TPA: septum formation initiator family protein [Actinomycetota bacterium]|nr:septum formation initiator family protein [Actinomycetota bacterium]
MRTSAAARPTPKRDVRSFVPQIVVFVLVVGLVGAMAIEPTRQLIEQRERIDEMASEAARIEALNAKLDRRIDRLKDPDFIEQRARAQVGLIRPGETTFVVMPPAKKARRDEPRKSAPPAPEPGTLESFLRFVGLSS